MKEEFMLLAPYERMYAFTDEKGKKVNGMTSGFAVAFFQGGASVADRIEVLKCSKQADMGKLRNSVGKRVSGTLVFDRFGRLCSIC